MTTNNVAQTQQNSATAQKNIESNLLARQMSQACEAERSKEEFEAEIRQYGQVAWEYLRSIELDQEFPLATEVLVMAIRELYWKGQLSIRNIPGLTETYKLRLELLLYHHEADLIEKIKLRAEIEKAHQIFGKFELAYKAFLDSQQSDDTDSDEKLRLEIKALMAETDPIKRVRKKRDIATHQNISYRDIDFLVRSIQAETRQSKVEVLDLDTLLSQGSEAINWIVPGLLPAGETVLLVAMPKVGKSLLGVDLAFCLSTAESSFLGERINPTKVLLISADESKNSTRAKLLKRGFRHGDNNLKCLFGWDISQMAQLETILEDYRPGVVIIDSLKRITLGKEISENSAEFGDMVYELKETLERYGAAGILIHHANKDKEYSGLASVRGSTAIAGAVWGIWQLDYVKTSQKGKKGKQDSYDPEDLGRTLTISARDSQGQIIHSEVNLENNSFTRILTELDHEKRSHAAQVLDLLAQYPYGLNGTAIAQLTGIKSIYSVLGRLSEQRLIDSFPAPDDRRRMVYRISDFTSPPPPIIESEPSIANPETQTQQEEEIPHKIPHKIDHKHLNSEYSSIENDFADDSKEICISEIATDAASSISTIHSMDTSVENSPVTVTEIPVTVPQNVSADDSEKEAKKTLVPHQIHHKHLNSELSSVGEGVIPAPKNQESAQKEPPTQPKSRHKPPTDDRLPLIQKVENLAKNIAQPLLDEAIKQVYGEVIAIQKLSKICLELLIQELGAMPSGIALQE
ncbi:ATP-binding protein [Planktothricoides raciborskii]|uniref:AAA family ATPase n=1 Tax=Planktothricoides raciborskii FACHB-1370 TaxID=2949576 RepID=A0ABR8EFD0_9CYAN|nr:AAA family ATPase [Planktothricoides raciborskii]MBD2544277.1 AAA family ATPase [Planktothricoides raciborskii FACHB-1370]MBD2583629.1 AAA family ATPase [Planktothricoides raciborskii FACHB-1261]